MPVEEESGHLGLNHFLITTLPVQVIAQNAITPIISLDTDK